jgi:hypothetical protein
LYRRGKIRDEDQFHELIAAELPSDIGGKTMTLAQLHWKRGKQQGKQNACLEIAQNSLRKGLDPVLVAILSFGPVPASSLLGLFRYF